MNYFLPFLSLIISTQILLSDPPQKKLSELNNKELIALCQEASQQTKEAELKENLRVNSTVLNGEVIVAFEDEIIFENCPGYTTLHKKNSSTKMDSTTIIELASISKQFTAAAILKLASEGKLALKDPITKYLPSLPYSRVTIEMLLTHKSGISEYINRERQLQGYPKLSNQQLVDFYARNHPKILSQPNTTFKYINTNYAFLASIVEKVSGMPFDDYVRKNMFEPAGMKDIYFYPEIANVTKNKIAKGHLWNKQQVPYHSMNYTLGDKGIYTTASDIYKWFQAYFVDYKIIPKKYVDLACTSHTLADNKNPDDPSKYYYVLGLRIEENPKFGKLVYHGGLWRGFHNIMVYRPKDKIFMIFLSNFRNKAHNGKCDQLLGIIDGA